MMSKLRKNSPWPACLVVGFCCLFLVLCSSYADDLSAQLSQAAALQSKGGASFVALMDSLGRQKNAMSDHQRWEFGYLQGWKLVLDGNYESAAALLTDINKRADTVDLREKAGSRLVHALILMNRSADAFRVANRLVDNLPNVANAGVKVDVLDTLSSLLREAGKYDLAVDYARQAMATPGKGMSRCRPMTYYETVLYDDHRLTSNNTDLEEAIEACNIE